MKTINDFLQELNDSKNSELDLAYYYNDGDTFEQYSEGIFEAISQNEIIYYSNSIEFLSKNDPSLNWSMEIASGLGYTTENLNSELLSTLVHQQMLHEEFGELSNEIEEYFDEYEEYLNELEEA